MAFCAMHALDGDSQWAGNFYVYCRENIFSVCGEQKKKKTVVYTGF